MRPTSQNTPPPIHQATVPHACPPFPHTLTYNPTIRACPFQRTHSFSHPLIVIIFMSLHSQFMEFDVCTHPPPPVRCTVSRGCIHAPKMCSHKSPQVAAFVLIQSHLHVFNSSIQDRFSWPLRGGEFSCGHTSTLCLSHEHIQLPRES